MQNEKCKMQNENGKHGKQEAMKTLRFVIIPAVLFLLPGIGQAGWFWQNPLPQGNRLWSVYCLNDTTGFTVGSFGTILKTTDGGANWVSQASGSTVWLRSVHFPMDALTGYTVGWYGTILKTTNGGANWVSQSSGTTNGLNSVHFPVDAQTGYAVGSGGVILKTTDGGTNWVSQTGTSVWLTSVHFPVDAQTDMRWGGLEPS